MTTTFPQPTIRRPDIKRLAVTGVTVLAAAAAIIGVQTAINDNQAAPSAVTVTDAATASTGQSIAFDPGHNVTRATAPGYIHGAELERFAERNGLSGLSQASLGPAAGSIAVPDTAGPADHAPTFFLEINDVAPAGDVGVDVTDSADLKFLQGIGSSVTNPAPAGDVGVDVTDSADHGSVEWLQANGWLPETLGVEVELQSRSNFGSDADWLEANGWTESSATQETRDLAFFMSINDVDG